MRAWEIFPACLVGYLGMWALSALLFVLAERHEARQAGVVLKDGDITSDIWLSLIWPLMLPLGLIIQAVYWYSGLLKKVALAPPREKRAEGDK